MGVLVPQYLEYINAIVLQCSLKSNDNFICEW